jgi:diguanylate cyclase (GGDEF)-like protein
VPTDLTNEDATTGLAMLSHGAGMGNIVRRVVRSLAGLALAYAATRWIGAAMFDGTPDGPRRLVAELPIFVVGAAFSVVVVSAVPIRRDLIRIRRTIASNDADLRSRHASQRFLRDVHNAFEMAEYEPELFELAGDALAEATPGRSEILVADASHAHLTRVALATGREAPACGVQTPRHCPAVRRGHTLTFADPSGLSACPRLRERQLDEGTVAACVPINVLGVPAAVLHSTYDTATMTEVAVDVAAGVRALEGVAFRFGTRLGVIRAIMQMQLQADTDPLTGLLNRRAMENRVRSLRGDGIGFAVAMADLDHFKDLNDTYGHDTGDRALRLFARTMATTVRDADIVCRHGGEEFVIVLPGTTVVTAAPILHRIREQLAQALTTAELPQFTVSIGLTDSAWSTELPELLTRADLALRTAKADGRDQVVIADDEAAVAPATLDVLD